MQCRIHPPHILCIPFPSCGLSRSRTGQVSVFSHCSFPALFSTLCSNSFLQQLHVRVSAVKPSCLLQYGEQYRILASRGKKSRPQNSHFLFFFAVLICSRSFQASSRPHRSVLKACVEKCAHNTQKRFCGASSRVIYCSPLRSVSSKIPSHMASFAHLLRAALRFFDLINSAHTIPNPNKIKQTAIITFYLLLSASSLL